MADAPSAPDGPQHPGTGSEGVASGAHQGTSLGPVNSAELSQAMGQLDVAVVVWDQQGKIILGNEYAAELFGRPLSELVGQPVIGLAEPTAEIERSIAGLLSGSFDAYHATRIIHADGHETPIRGTSRAIELDGHRVGVTLVIPDSEFFRLDRIPYSWQDLVPVCIGMADAEWTIKAISADVEELLGVTPAACIGKSLLALAQPDDVAILEEAKRAGVPSPVSIPRVRFIVPEGAPSEACVLLAPRTNGDARAISFALVGLLEDYLPEPADRIEELELRLRRIAAELRAAGVIDSMIPVPAIAEHPQLGELTARQWEILSRLLRGERVPTIAKELYISPSTVRNHLAKIFEKFGVHTQAELIERLRTSQDPADL